MKTIEIFGDDRYPEYTKISEGCRGILVCEGKILLSYLREYDRWLIPGGHLEAGEILAECCERELVEETGVIARAHTHYLTLEEYYHEWYFKSHYFLCDYIGDCEPSLTQNEKLSGLEPRWIDFDEALKIFGSYENYKNKNKVKYGTYYREYLALCEIKNIKK